ncbi:MAG: type II secretion system protein M [Synergistaceae bacterium]|jgi:hypothetical protein|nr:type II secretion system protein M [Synergistaceae bacterium]
MNFDLNFNKIRSIIRGEVNGSARFLVVTFCAAASWIAASWFSDMSKNASLSLTQQETRYQTLSQLAAEYKSLASDPSDVNTNAVDVMTTFTRVSAQVELGSRVTRIAPAPDGRRCTVEINRLYAEEMTEIVRALAARGIRVISAEIRALPAGEERLFSLYAVIGTEA